jgi:CysZ protein
VTSVLFTAVLVGLVTQLDTLVAWLTPFVADWSPGLATFTRIAVGFALVAGAALVMVLTFSALTLTLGAPLYDRISESVDRELGDLPAVAEERWTSSAGRAVRQTLLLVAISVLGGVLLFLCGFVPVVGQTVVPVASAVFGGWMLALELVGSALERRGRPHLVQRRAALRRRRARVLGLAVPSFLLLAVPFAAVLVFPVATAAATLLARDLVPGPAAPPGREPGAGKEPGPVRELGPGRELGPAR